MLHILYSFAKAQSNFTTFYEPFHDLVSIFKTLQNQFHELYNFISQRMVHHT